MLLRKMLTTTVIGSVVALSVPSQTAEAGPLLDWLFGRRPAPAYAVGQPVPLGYGYAAGYGGSYAANPAYSAGYGGYPSAAYSNSLMPVPANSAPGYGNGTPLTMVPPAQTSMSYVPNFRDNYYRAPVTYYRPVLTTDPATGAQSVSMAPCTSYEMQNQRVPALGQSALYGSYSPPTYAPSGATPPTYTLPSGGVPLAYSSPSTVRSYGNYPTQPYSAQSYPAQPVVPAGSYQAYQPGAGQYYETNPYYGSTTGGCSGGYPGTVTPGLSAPPQPYNGSGVPSTTYPSTSPYPSQDVLPSTNSQDPANIPPSLSSNSVSKPNELRSQLKQVTQTPVPESLRAQMPSQPSNSFESESAQPERMPVNMHSVKPMPVPDDFNNKSQWSPGLIRESDPVAAITQPLRLQVAERQRWAEVAGQSKPIRWASFNVSRTSQPEAELPELKLELAAPIQPPVQLGKPPVFDASPAQGMVPVPAWTPESANTPAQSAGPSVQPTTRGATPAEAAPQRRSRRSSNWEAVGQ